MKVKYRRRSEANLIGWPLRTGYSAAAGNAV